MYTPYVVMESQLRQANNGVRIAVVERVPGMDTMPRMISPHAKGVVRIVREWPQVYKGKTRRSRYARIRADAVSLAARLNARRHTGQDELGV